MYWMLKISIIKILDTKTIRKKLLHSRIKTVDIQMLEL